MSTSLQRYSAQRVESAPVPATIDEAIRVGQLMAMFDQDGKPENAAAKVMAGMELGIGPMASIRGIHMIKGKPSLSGDLLASLVKRSGRYDFRSSVKADRATVTIYDRGEALDPVDFTIDDAKTAGLTSSDMYKKYPGDMLFNRAMVRAVKRHCPEVGGGAVYIEDGDEPLGEAPSPFAASDGDVIDSTATVTTPSAEDIGRERFTRLRESGLSDEAIVAALRERGIESSVQLADDATWETATEAIIDATPAPSGDDALADQLFADTAKGDAGKDPHS